eukprot:Partr_v1_DN24672_c1_g1_i1_m59905
MQRFRLACSSGCMRCLNSAGRLLGPALVTFAVVLIGGCSIFALFVVLPELDVIHNDPSHAFSSSGSSTSSPDVKNSTSWMVRRSYCVTLWLLTLIWFNYVKAVTTNPGNPGLPSSNASKAASDSDNPESISLQMINYAESDPLSAAYRSTAARSGREPRTCRKCHQLKPSRCHHCSVCQTCVLRFVRFMSCLLSLHVLSRFLVCCRTITVRG